MIQVNIQENNYNFSQVKYIVYQLWELIIDNMFSNLKVQEKPWKEIVTWLDKEVEKEAKKLIKRHYWNVNFVWEEFWEENNWSEITFIIDPIDWTESFVDRSFNTSISIWILIWWVMEYWIVYDFMKGFLYEWKTNPCIYFRNKKVPFLRENYSEKTRVLISGGWEEIDELQYKIGNNNDLKVIRRYWSIALQLVETWAWNYDSFIRVWKVGSRDIAWAMPFIKGLEDIVILSRKWEEFDFKNPEDWFIVVKKTLRKEILNTLDL